MLLLAFGIVHAFSAFSDRELVRPELVAGTEGQLEGAAGAGSFAGSRGAAPVLCAAQRTGRPGLLLRNWGN